MLIIGHPIYFVNALRSERCSYDDGLLQRILMCAPNPPRVRAKEMREKKSGDQVTLIAIFYFLRVLHQDQYHVYTFTAEAYEIIDYQFDLHRI